MVSQKDGILYFGVYKTDKSGIYALGQVDSGDPIALILSKRFSTTDYSAHKPIGLFIHGSNYYGAYNDTDNLACRCESMNDPQGQARRLFLRFGKISGLLYKKRFDKSIYKRLSFSSRYSFESLHLF